MEKPPKVGLDDFLRVEGKAGWSRLVAAAETLPDLQVFRQFNREYAMLEKPLGLIVRFVDGQVVKPKPFLDFVSPVQMFKGGQKVNAGREWMNWPRMRRVAKEIFLPHPIGESPAPNHVEFFEGEYCYNHWRAWPATPAATVDNDAIQIYFAVRDWQLDDQPEVIKWLECWIAHKLMNPTTKQPTVPILVGDEGCGKDSLGRFFTKLFGAHGEDIPGGRIDSKFNGFMGHRLFVNVSELEDASPQFFKNLVSNKVEFIERKGIDAITQPSYLQLFASTNERTPYLIKSGDRRGGIFKVCRGRLGMAARIDTNLVAKLESLIAEPKNLRGVYPYFINHDLKGYNPFTEPPRTADKEELIRQHRSDGEQFIFDVIADAESYWVENECLGDVLLRKPKRCDLGTVRDFAYLPDAPESLRTLLKDRRGESLVGKWLAEVLPRGRVNNGQQIRTIYGPRRLWPVRNPDRWYQASVSEISQHYWESRQRLSEQEKTNVE